MDEAQKYSFTLQEQYSTIPGRNHAEDSISKSIIDILYVLENHCIFTFEKRALVFILVLALSWRRGYEADKMFHNHNGFFKCEFKSTTTGMTLFLAIYLYM